MNFFLLISKKCLNLLLKIFPIHHYYSIPVKNQKYLFRSVGLDRSLGLEALNKVIKKEFSITYDENNGMFSEHLVILSAIAQSKIKKINSVLEIGTFDGRTAVILNKLFPSASITTVDLPDNDAEFSSTYRRNKLFSEFINRRNNLLNSCSNIKFKKINSLNLVNCNKSFDVILIDGAHGFPVIAMDVINAYRLSSEGGFVLIDDVFVSGDCLDDDYKSIGGFRSLSALKSAKLIKNFILFNKRLGGKYNLRWEKKYVGFFRKNKI